MRLVHDLGASPMRSSCAVRAENPCNASDPRKGDHQAAAMSKFSVADSHATPSIRRRDCSVSGGTRSDQEAPCPVMTPETREQNGAAAR